MWRSDARFGSWYISIRAIVSPEPSAVAVAPEDVVNVIPLRP